MSAARLARAARERPSKLPLIPLSRVTERMWEHIQADLEATEVHALAEKLENLEDEFNFTPSQSEYLNEFRGVRLEPRESNNSLPADLLQDQNRSLTDEGYGSLTYSSADSGKAIEPDLDDTQTVYSDTPSMRDPKASAYISELARDLSNKLLRQVSRGETKQIVDQILGVLEERLKAFALKVGHGDRSQMHRDVMVFIHKNRREIAECFAEYCTGAEIDSTKSESDDVPNMSLQDKMALWNCRLDDAEPTSTETQSLGSREYEPLGVPIPNCESQDGSEEESPDMPELLAYRDFMSRSSAYEWLLENLHREISLSPVEPNCMETIRRSIIGILPSAPRISRKVPADTFSVNFQMDWDVKSFLKSQDYGVPEVQAVRQALTLTGSAVDAQALPCVEYLRQTWPTTATAFVELLESVVRDDSNRRHIKDFSDGTKIIVWTDGRKFSAEAIGTAESVAEIVQQTAWIGAAMRPSPYISGVSLCRPFIKSAETDDPLTPAGSGPIKPLPKGRLVCRVGFAFEKTRLSSNGQCWHDLFRNSVVVLGFPIRRRSHSGTGIEIPLPVMAALVDTQLVNKFKVSYILKGFSAMLVATRCIGQLILWHHLYSNFGERISYSNSNGICTDGTTTSDLEAARHIVGWCSASTYHAGSADAAYKVQRSRLRRTHSGCVLEKCSIYGGQFISAGGSFVLGLRDRPVRITRMGYLRKVQWISKKFVVFWDEDEKRGWLVNGASALLHLVRASMDYDADDGNFAVAYKLKQSDLTESTAPFEATSALHVLLHKDNRHLVLCNIDGEEVEKGLRVEDTPKTAGNGGKPYHTFQDRVEQIYESLEKTVDHEIDANNQTGVKLKIRARRYLEGWDFKDLATYNDPFYSRVSTLQAFGKGWVDFTRSIHAITLFGRGFGSLIKPAEGSTECKYWSKLPVGKFYLAAGGADMKGILDIYGDAYSRPLRISDDIVWLNPGQICSQCQCAISKRRFPFTRSAGHTELAQVLLPCSSVSFQDSSDQPRRFPDSAAFVFGHNINFPWYYKDSGDPKYGTDGNEKDRYDMSMAPVNTGVTRLTPAASEVTTGNSSSNSRGSDLENLLLVSRPCLLHTPSSQNTESGDCGREEDGEGIVLDPRLHMLNPLGVQRLNLSQPTFRHELKSVLRKRTERDGSDED